MCEFNPIAGEEWKVMGLAPYGKKDDTYYKLLNSLISIKDCNVKFKNNPNLILKVIGVINEDLNGSKESVFAKKANLAYTGQLLFSEYMIELLNNLYKKGYSENLALSGGCALNSAFNGKIICETNFKELYIPSAPGDDGTAIGAAYLSLKRDRPDMKMVRTNKLSPYLGNQINDQEVENYIKFSGNKRVEKYPGMVHMVTAKLLAQGKLIGWSQGRAEFGPRALGNRSILADPRKVDMKDVINSRIKFREEFRPFAPSILAEYGNNYFEDYQDSPYMERTLKFKDEVLSKIPAVVHVDQTGRLQSVSKDLNPTFHALIDCFNQLTGVPIILNTSFNVMGKPIINSFQDALNVFYNSGLDVLVINDYVISK